MGGKPKLSAKLGKQARRGKLKGKAAGKKKKY
jgi:hypothetical protein